MNKYQDALNLLARLDEYDLDGASSLGDRFYDHIETLQELIDLHTKALTLDEIKNHMWVYDACMGEYIQISRNPQKDDNFPIYFYCVDYQNEHYSRFKENRFYRYKPLQVNTEEFK